MYTLYLTQQLHAKGETQRNEGSGRWHAAGERERDGAPRAPLAAQAHVAPVAWWLQIAQIRSEMPQNASKLLKIAQNQLNLRADSTFQGNLLHMLTSDG